MNRNSLKREEANEYYDRYIAKLDEDLDLRAGFEIGKQQVIDFFSSIPQEKLTYRYAEGKWSIKEILQHLIDAERVFSYRMFRIGRGDMTPLADFDQNPYIEPSRADEKGILDLLEEFKNLRQSSIDLVNSFTDTDLERVGVSSNHPMSARVAAFVIIGHEIWHMDIIKERYL